MTLNSRKFPTDQGACDPGESARVPLKEKRKKKYQWKKKCAYREQKCYTGMYKHVKQTNKNLSESSPLINPLSLGKTKHLQHRPQLTFYHCLKIRHKFLSYLLITSRRWNIQCNLTRMNFPP